jgi:hypothetical protein
VSKMFTLTAFPATSMMSATVKSVSCLFMLFYIWFRWDKS